MNSGDFKDKPRKIFLFRDVQSTLKESKVKKVLTSEMLYNGINIIDVIS